MKDPQRKPAYLQNRPSAGAGAKNVVHVSDATFQREVVNSSIPVLVDFWAPWCGPCKMIAPLVEELATEYAGRIKFVKLNTEENPGVPGSLGIRSIPTLVLFKGKSVVDHRVGALPKEALRQMLDGALGVKQPGILSKLFGGQKGES